MVQETKLRDQTTVERVVSFEMDYLLLGDLVSMLQSVLDEGVADTAVVEFHKRPINPDRPTWDVIVTHKVRS